MKDHAFQLSISEVLGMGIALTFMAEFPPALVEDFRKKRLSTLTKEEFYKALVDATTVVSRITDTQSKELLDEMDSSIQPGLRDS